MNALGCSGAALRLRPAVSLLTIFVGEVTAMSAVEEISDALERSAVRLRDRLTRAETCTRPKLHSTKALKGLYGDYADDAAFNLDQGRDDMLRGFYYSVAVVACCATSALGQQAGGLSEADAKQAASMISKAWDDAYNAGDPHAIAALFGPDGVYLTPAGTMLKNPQDMEKALAARQKAGWTKESIKVVDAHAVGDRVSAIVEYTLFGSGPNAGQKIGGYAAELLSRSGSDWRFDLVAANLAPTPNLIPDVTGMTGVTGDNCVPFSICR